MSVGINTAMILAAGRGNRLRPLTDTIPKPLVEVAGQSLLQRHIVRLTDVGITRIVINVAYLPEKIKMAVREMRSSVPSLNGVEILFSDEPEGGLETAGGIINALPLLDAEQFLVVNADIYTDYEFKQLTSRLLHNKLAHLVMVPVPPEKDKPDFYLHNKSVSLTPGLGEGKTFAGISLMRRALFDGMDAGFLALRPVLEKVIASASVSGECCTDLWCDVGTLERLESLRAQLNA